MTAKHLLFRRLGYARASAYGQTLDAQLEELRKAGCKLIFQEKAARVRPNRPTGTSF